MSEITDELAAALRLAAERGEIPIAPANIYSGPPRRSEDDVKRLIQEAVEVAEYGLGRDGCPFCNAVTTHSEDCIAVVFGARSYAGDVHPEDQTPDPMLNRRAKG